MRSSQGVTLVELLVVMSIMAMIVALGAAGMGTLGERRVEREASAIYAWLRLVQREAMLRGRPIQILAKDGALTASPGTPDLATKIPKYSRLTAKSDHPVWKSLCFFPDGSACPGYVDISTGSGDRRLRVGWLGDVSIVR